jgi:hypothetical protein
MFVDFAIEIDTDIGVLRGAVSVLESDDDYRWIDLRWQNNPGWQVCRDQSGRAEYAVWEDRIELHDSRANTILTLNMLGRGIFDLVHGDIGWGRFCHSERPGHESRLVWTAREVRPELTEWPSLDEDTSWELAWPSAGWADAIAHRENAAVLTCPV